MNTRGSLFFVLKFISCAKRPGHDRLLEVEAWTVVATVAKVAVIAVAVTAGVAAATAVQAVVVAVAVTAVVAVVATLIVLMTAGGRSHPALRSLPSRESECLRL